MNAKQDYPRIMASLNGKKCRVRGAFHENRRKKSGMQSIRSVKKSMYAEDTDACAEGAIVPTTWIAPLVTVLREEQERNKACLWPQSPKCAFTEGVI